MKKIFSLFAALTLSVGLWAANSVITFTSTSKLYPADINELKTDNSKWKAFQAQYPEFKDVMMPTQLMMGILFNPNAFLDANGQVLDYMYNYDDATKTGTITFTGELVTMYGKTGVQAFASCSLLTITLPEGLTSIGEYSFSECRNLTTVNLPASLTMIGNYAFAQCTSLTDVYVAWTTTLPTLGYDVFLGTPVNNATLHVPTGTTATYAAADQWKDFGNIVEPAPAVGDQFVDETSGLKFEITAVGETNTVKVIENDYEGTSYTIPASVSYKDVAFAVTEIDEVAFADRDALNSITIPASVITIGEYAFEYCDNLATVTFAEGSQLQTIGAWAFNSCEVLPNITIPASVTEIGEKTFLQCTALTDIYVEAANTHYISEDGVLFDYAKDKLIQYPIGNTRTTYTIPTTVTTIELFSFFNATLISVNIPASVTTIGESAFNECEALTSINIPASVTEIGELAFAFCPNLATITFSEGSQLTTIGYGAFSGCEVISSLDIPASVTKIGEVAFCCNPNLYNVTVHWTDANQLPEMGEEVFVGIAEEEGPSAATLHVPTGTKDMYEAADQWQDFIIEELAPAVEVYTRDVTEGNWGTICLPWESKALEGGIFYDVLGTIHAEYGVALTEIEEPNQLEAGKPYVFKATSDQIKVTYYPLTQVEAPVYDENHLYGSFEGCDVPEGKYIIYNNLLYVTDGSSKIGTNRAYFDVEEMDPFVQSQAPARVVFMGGHQTPTRLGGEAEGLKGRKAMKVIENGQFRIVRDGKTYNAQGIEL